MKIKKAVRTAVILTTFLTTGLTTNPSESWAGDNGMRPGGWANPYVARETRPGVVEIRPRYADPANPASMAPGSWLNPMVLEQQSDGSTVIRPWMDLPGLPGRNGQDLDRY